MNFLKILIFVMFFFSKFLLSSDINIESKYLEYDEANKYIVAAGSVTVVWKDRILNAEKIEFWPQKEYLTAEGNISITENDNTILGDNITYDYKNSTGIINAPYGNFDKWFFSAKKITNIENKFYNVESIRTTTCNLYNPHYTIRGKRAKVFINKKIIIYHPVFYIRNIPILYFPKLWQSLTSPKYSIEVMPGHNSIDGLFAKTVIGYPLNKNSYGKLYIDYFSKRGVGYGTEYNYYYPDIKGTIYGYRMKEDTTKNEYWNFRASHLQKLNDLWTCRSDINYENNTTYNNFYFNDNWQLTRRTINSNISFTRQTSRSSVQLISSRYDIFNSTTGVFEPQSITLPSIEYNLYSIIKTLPFTNSMRLSFSNQYDTFNNEYLKRANLYASIRKGYSMFNKKLTFNPDLGIGETWYETISDTDSSHPNNFVTRYYSNYNFRYYLSRLITWDVGYSYVLRSQINKLMPDYDADDYGEESNKIYFQNTFYKRKFIIRNSTGYDLRESRSIFIEDWREKISPLVNEVTWTPTSRVNLYIREESGLYPAHSLNSVQTMVSIGQMDKKYVNFWVSYNEYMPDDVNYNTGFGFWVLKGLRMDYRLTAKTLEKFKEFRANDQELRIYKDLHCWELRLTFKRRYNSIDNTNADAVYFQINLKTLSLKKEKFYNKKHENEFYPWR